VLLVDIPSSPGWNTDPRLADISRQKARLENLSYSQPYARQFAGRQYGYGILSISRFIKDLDVAVDYIDIESLKNEADPTILQTADVALIGLNFCTAESAVIDLAREVKRWNSDCAVVVGGQHATYRARELLEQSPHIDMVVKGEGEIPVRELMKYPELFYQMPGTVVRVDDEIVDHGFAPILAGSAILYPDYELLRKPLDQYGLRMVTQRGCLKPEPISCVFCAEKAFFRKPRMRTIESIRDELDYLSQNIKIRPAHIHIADSIFPSRAKRTKDLCREMQSFTDAFEFSCNLYASSLSEDMLQAMREANFTRLFVGLEDPSTKILKRMKKGIELADVLKTLEKTKRLGFQTAVYTVFGLPGSTAKSLAIHTERIAKLVTDGLVDEVFDAMYVPTPGSDSFNNPRLYNMEIIEEDFSKHHRQGWPVYRLRGLSAEDLAEGYLEFRRAIVAAYMHRGLET